MGMKCSFLGITAGGAYLHSPPSRNRVKLSLLLKLKLLVRLTDLKSKFIQVLAKRIFREFKLSVSKSVYFIMFIATIRKHSLLCFETALSQCLRSRVANLAGY